MKKLLILAGVAAILFTSCGGSSSLKNEQDSLAYAIGLDFGKYLKEQVDSTLDINVVAAAIKDVMKNNPKLDEQTSRDFMQEYFMVRKPAKAKKESEDFLASVEKDNKNIAKTESGLMYEILREGDNNAKVTKDDDVVRVMYSGTLPNGKVFDSSYERADTLEFALNRVIKGWGEGMKLIGKGGKIKLWIPSDLAYGERSPGGMIGPNQALVFEVELVDIKPAPAVTEEPVK